MKRIHISVAFALAVFISSCSMFLESRYTFIFQNNSDDALFFVMDFKPSSEGISSDNYSCIMSKKGDYHISRPNRDNWDKHVRDYVYVYLVSLDSLMNNGNSKFDTNDIKDSYIIARMTLKLEDFYNPEGPMKKICYPPSPESNLPIEYYK